MKNNALSPSDAARLLGSISTPKKAAAARANGFQPEPLTSFECTCGRCPDEYKVGIKAGAANCPRAKTIRQRNWRAKQKEQSQSESS